MKPEDQFHDYTLASKLERFVAAVEQTLVSWQRTGLAEIIHRGYRARIKEQPSQVKVVASLQHRLPWRREPYILQLHLPTALAVGRNGVPYSRPSAVPAGALQQQGPAASVDADSGAILPSAFPGATPSQPVAAACSMGLLEADRGTQGTAQANTQDQEPTDTMAGPVDHGGACDGRSGGGAADATAGAPAEDFGAPALSAHDGGDGSAIQSREGGPDEGDEDGENESHKTPQVLSARSLDNVAEADAQSKRGSGTASSGGGGGGDGNGGGGSGPGEAEPGWEVGVDLDLTELLSRIDTIVNDVEAQDTPFLDPDPGQLTEDVSDAEGEFRQDAAERDRSQTDTHQRKDEAEGDHGRERSEGHQESSEECKSTGGRVVQQRQVSELDTAGSNYDGGVRSVSVSGSDKKAASLTHGSRGAGPALAASGTGGDAAAATASASAQLAAVWLNGRPAALPWWLPTFQHRLQRWFGLDAFLLMHPASFSRRILDETEAGTLLSAAALALAASGLSCPLLLPVHDGLRDAFWGVAVLPGVGCLHLKTDSVHISSPPRELTQLPAQLCALGEQLMPFSPSAAMACFDAAAQADDQRSSLEGPSATRAAGMTGSGGDTEDDRIKITWSGCFTYQVTKPSRRLRVQVERWSKAAATGPLASQGKRTATSGEGGSGGSGGGGTAAALPYLRSSSHVCDPLNPWRLSPTTAVIMSGDGDDGGADGGLNSSAAPAHAGECDNDAKVDGGRPGNGGDDHDDEGDEGDDDGFGVFSDAEAWDAHAPWHPWAVQADPVALLELDVAWEDVHVPLQPSAVSEQQEQQQGRAELQVGSSHRWLLHALQVGTGGSGGFGLSGSMWGRVGLKPREAQRRHVELQRAGADWLWNALAADSWRRPGGQSPPAVTPVSAASQVGPGSFTVMLSSLLTGRSVAAEAVEVGELLDPEWWEARGWAVPPLPPPHVMQDVLQDLFNHAAPRPPADEDAPPGRDAKGSTKSVGGGGGSASIGPPYNSPYQRTAPLQGLLSRLALHALLFGNARAVAWLWQRFVRELRFGCWDVDRRLPRTATAPPTPPLPSPPPPPLPDVTSASASDTAVTLPKLTTVAAEIATGGVHGSGLHGGSGRASGDRDSGGGSSGNGSRNSSIAAQRENYDDNDGDGDGDCDGSDDGELSGVKSTRGVAGIERLLIRQHQEEPSPPCPNLRRCLLQQKLQVLDVCIHRKRMLAKQQHLVRHLEQKEEAHGQQLGQGRVVRDTSASISRQHENRQVEDWDLDDSWWSELSTGWMEQSEQQGTTTGGGGGGGGDGFTIRSRVRKSSRHGSGLNVTLGDGAEQRARRGAPRSPTQHKLRHTADGVVSSNAAAGATDDAAADSGGFAATATADDDATCDESRRRTLRDRIPSPASALPLVPSVTDTEAYFSAGDEPDEAQRRAGRGPVAASAAGDNGGRRQVPAATAAAKGSGSEAPGRSRVRVCFRVRAPALTQPAPVLSEDRMLERQAALEGLAMHPQGRELAWRMNSEQLASDMAAFKAANPRGCTFADFIAWYSPRDVMEETEVAREAAEEGPVATTVEVTMVAVSEQKAEARQQGSEPDPGPKIGCETGGGTNSGADRRRRHRHDGGGDGGGHIVLSARMGSRALPGSSAFGTDVADAAATAATAATAPAIPPSGPSNPWKRLWEATDACPVWKQKPLQDPALEGERVLHELDTLSPAHLYDTLLATALEAAVQLLAASDGGSLEPVSSLLRQYVRISAPIVKRGCSLVAGSVSPSAPASKAGGGANRPMGHHQPSSQALMGWEDAELEYLLAEFHYLEQAVVLGESLVRRLPGNRGLAADLMTATLQGNPSLEEGRTVMRPAAWVEGRMARQALAALLAGRCPAAPAAPPSGAVGIPHLQRHHLHQHQQRGSHHNQGHHQSQQYPLHQGRQLEVEGGKLIDDVSGVGSRSRTVDGWEGADWDDWEGSREGAERGLRGGNGGSGGGGRGNVTSVRRRHVSGAETRSCSQTGKMTNVVFRTDLWPSPCSREWLLKVRQPLGHGALLQQLGTEATDVPYGDATPDSDGDGDDDRPTRLLSATMSKAGTSHPASAPCDVKATLGASSELQKKQRSQKGGTGQHRRSGDRGGGRAAGEAGVPARSGLRAERLGLAGGDGARCHSSVSTAAGGSGKSCFESIIKDSTTATSTSATATTTTTNTPTAAPSITGGGAVGEGQLDGSHAATRQQVEAQAGGELLSCTHRLYVLAVSGEMRVATAMWHTT